MFQAVLGDIHRAVNQVAGDRGFEARIFQILAETGNEEELRRGLDELGDSLKTAANQPPEEEIDRWL